LKGHGFSRAAKIVKKTMGFSPWGTYSATFEKHPSGAEQAAEKLIRVGKKRQGTTSVVP